MRFTEREKTIRQYKEWNGWHIGESEKHLPNSHKLFNVTISPWSFRYCRDAHRVFTFNYKQSCKLISLFSFEIYRTNPTKNWHFILGMSASVFAIINHLYGAKNTTKLHFSTELQQQHVKNEHLFTVISEQYLLEHYIKTLDPMADPISVRNFISLNSNVTMNYAKMFTGNKTAMSKDLVNADDVLFFFSLPREITFLRFFSQLRIRLITCKSCV